MPGIALTLLATIGSPQTLTLEVQGQIPFGETEAGQHQTVLRNQMHLHTFQYFHGQVHPQQ